MCISRNNQFIISAGKDNIITMWDLSNLSREIIIGNHNGFINSVCISEND